jgi:hypothetical protein
MLALVMKSERMISLLCGTMLMSYQTSEVSESASVFVHEIVIQLLEKV